jgi:hypothetical protein
MNARIARRVIRSLRCSKCRRTPTPSEQQEMFEDFGRKLMAQPGGGRLIWNCRACFPHGDASMRPN